MEKNNQFHELLSELPNAFAHHQIIVNKNGKPVDYIFLYVNPAFLKMTGLTEHEVVGRKVTEVFPDIKKTSFDWIGTYGKVSLERKPIRLEQYFEPLKRWYDVTAFSDQPGYFAVAFLDITRIKTIEKRLRQSEQQNRSIVEALPDMIIVADRRGRYLDIITQEPEKLIKPKKEMLRANITDLLPKKEASKVMAAIKKSTDNQSLQVVEYQLEVPAGKLFFEARITPYKTNQVIALIRDITGKKKAEETLSRERANYEKLVDTAPGAICQYCLRPDGSSHYPYCSPAIKDVYGFSPEQLAQDAALVRDRIHPEDSKRVNDAISKSAKELIPWHSEYRFNHPKKGEIWLSVRFAPTREADGSTVWHGIIFDISRRKQAEQALQESEKKHRRLYETMAQGVIYQTADGKIASANPAGERILGITTDQMSGKTSMDSRWKMIKEDGTPVPGIEHPTMIALRTGQKVGPVTRGIYRPDLESHIWLKITAIPLFESGGRKPFQAYATFEDITAQKEAERALKRQVAFEKLVSDISSSFVDSSPSEIDRDINLALRQAGKFFHVDRSYVFQISSDAKTMHKTHEWCAEGIDCLTNISNNFHIDLFPWWAKKIQKPEYVYVPDIKNLPTGARAEKNQWAQLSIQSLLDIPLLIKGNLFGFFGFASVKEKKLWTEQDITLLKVLTDTISNAIAKNKLEKEVRQSHQRMLTILDSLEAIIYVADMKTHEVLFINRYSQTMWGDIRGKKCWKALQEGQKGPCHFCTNDRLLDQEGRPTGVYSWEHFNTKTGRWYACKDAAIRWIDGRMVRLELAVDITQAKKAEQKILYMGFHDSLTGLYNRSYMEQEMARLDTQRQLPISIIMADLNGLKLINDTYGHASGDTMLKKAASILKKFCRKEDIIARWGGDEFVILLTKTPEKEAARIAARIISGCRNVYIQDVPLSLALGYANKSHDGQNLIDVLKKAENNMYQHKLTRSRSARSAIANTLLRTLREKSFETERHVKNMRAFALKIGRKLSLAQSELDRLSLLAMLHDIGKVNIPKEILTKTSSLTSRQWKTLKEHPLTGYRIALAIPEFSYLAEDILSHHERWDGLGYPQGLKGKKIPLLARIVAIADAYEVMTNGRIYKKPLTKSEAIAELKKHAGTRFDPALVDVFISALT